MQGCGEGVDARSTPALGVRARVATRRVSGDREGRRQPRPFHRGGRGPAPSRPRWGAPPFCRRGQRSKAPALRLTRDPFRTRRERPGPADAHPPAGSERSCGSSGEENGRREGRKLWGERERENEDSEKAEGRRREEAEEGGESDYAPLPAPSFFRSENLNSLWKL